jgi:hypothetical protein
MTKQNNIFHKDNEFNFWHDRKNGYNLYKCNTRHKCNSILKLFPDNKREVTRHSRICIYHTNKKKLQKDPNPQADSDLKLDSEIIDNINMTKNVIAEEEDIESLFYYDKEEVDERANEYKIKYDEHKSNKKAKRNIMKLPKKLTIDQKSLLQKSIKDAFKVRCLKFSDDLVFSINIAGIMVDHDTVEMNEGDKPIYYQAKQDMLYGNYPPIKIIKNIEHNGFIVKATDSIPSKTFICEYSGEVKLENKISVENDSLMGLLRSENKEDCLDIIPDKISNIARFISGINNETMEIKQNVETYRCKIDGSIHVLLIASKNIKKGDTLFYDYNEGYDYNDRENEIHYDTSYFTNNNNADDNEVLAFKTPEKERPKSFIKTRDYNSLTFEERKKELGLIWNQTDKIVKKDEVLTKAVSKEGPLTFREKLMNSRIDIEIIKREKAAEKKKIITDIRKKRKNDLNSGIELDGMDMKLLGKKLNFKYYTPK